MKPMPLLLCLSTSLLLCGSLFAQEAIDESRAVSANERISIEVARGTATIRVSQDNVFRVRGTLDEEAEGYTLDSANGFTRFEVETPRRLRGGGLFGSDDEGSQLTFEVPVNAELEFEGVNTDVSVDGIQGSTSISSVNGEIIASNLASFVELSTVNGKIESNNNSGRLTLSTVNGEIHDEASSGRAEFSSVNGELYINSNATEVSVSTVNGEADVHLQGSEELEMSTVNGDINVRMAASLSPRVEGSTVSGDLRLQLEPQVNARFDLNASVSGDIDNRLSDERASRRGRYGPGSSLNFSTGDGSGSIDMTTVSGDLEVDSL
ncbi:MAG: DUF4097 family beta strand repeat protein [Pseudomonadales bacterium]|nr:DUF4097 family beta strand repeat protein [Pseudomonadales bacterium]